MNPKARAGLCDNLKSILVSNLQEKNRGEEQRGEEKVEQAVSQRREQDIMISSDTVKKKIMKNGADICGIAPLSRFENAPKGFHPSDIYPDCRSVIVFASHFPLSTLKAKTNSPYTFVRNIMVQKLDLISFYLSDELEKDGVMEKQYCNPIKKYLSHLAIFFVLLVLSVGSTSADAQWPNVVLSKDGTPISYEIHGAGEPTLVFVHGWSCDARYWRQQLSYFSKKYRVVLLDLAGHGHSGSTRLQYTMRAFGEDVQAVSKASGSQNVILIGRSMGGSVIAEAARLMPNRVKGIIGVDTLENIEYPITREEFDQMIAPLKKEFQTGSRQFVKEMISPKTDPQLRDWILLDISAAPPAVALSAMEEMISQYITGEAARIFNEIRIPVIAVNGDLWPIDYEANRRHMFSFDAIVLKGADHFLMMNRPIEFNHALEKAITAILTKIPN